MNTPAPRYRSRLNALTVLCMVALAIPPFALAYAIAGIEGSLGFVIATLVMGLLRTSRVELAGTIRLRQPEAPGLFALIESLARRAGLNRMPEVCVVPGGQVNAAATLKGNAPVLVVTEALLERLDVRRLGAVLAHEMSHLAHGDLVVFRLAHTLQVASLILALVTGLLAMLSLALDPATAVFWAVIASLTPVFSRFLVAVLSRTREFAADLGAAALTGDPGALADALAIIEYRPRTWWDWLAGTRSPVPDTASNAFRTHPATSERIRRLTWLTNRGGRATLWA